MKTWIIATALGVALSAVGASGAFAQAGSTGGTIGKTDKSVSGGEEEISPRRDKTKTPRAGPHRGGPYRELELDGTLWPP